MPIAGGRGHGDGVDRVSVAHRDDATAEPRSGQARAVRACCDELVDEYVQLRGRDAEVLAKAGVALAEHAPEVVEVAVRKRVDGGQNACVLGHYMPAEWLPRHELERCVTQGRETEPCGELLARLPPLRVRARVERARDPRMDGQHRQPVGQSARA